MTDTPPPKPTQNADAREAGEMGEKPDLGAAADTLIDALSGTDSGSDTRAGSLRGGSASGSDDDPDSARINAELAQRGRAEHDPAVRPAGGPEHRSDRRQPGDDVDAPTG